MMTRLIILGCGNSMGVPRIDGFGESVIKITQKTSGQDAPRLS